jgi:type I restriction enzyme S subunit
VELGNCIEKIDDKHIKIQKCDVVPNGKRKVISQEDKPWIGFSNLESGYIADKNLPAILFGDHNLNIKFIKKECFVGADGLKLLKAKQNIIPKYLYHYPSSENFTNDIKAKMNGEFY